jgi:hypothetical protein
VPIVGAAELEGIVEECRVWYAETRLWLIERIEEGGYPYGHVPKNQEQQLNEYLTMTGQSWSAMYQRMLDRFRGFPDASRRAAQAMTRYRDRMEVLRLESEQPPRGAIYG